MGAWSQTFGAGWIIPALFPCDYRATGTVMPLQRLRNSPLNPWDCSAVKSTASPADHSPPSAAFITKFMMKQFCALLLHWSRYRGKPAGPHTQNISGWMSPLRHAFPLQWSSHTRVRWDVGGWWWWRGSVQAANDLQTEMLVCRVEEEHQNHPRWNRSNFLE